MAAADFPDSSIGEGMDITIQGVNGHIKHENLSLRSHEMASENNAPAGYNPPSTDGGQLTLSGVTDSEFWFVVN